MISVRGVALALLVLVAAAISGDGVAAAESSGLEAVAAHVQALKSGPVVFGAHAGSEGHWTFVNRAGERITTSSADEMRRALPVLAPETAADAGGRAFVLSEATVFAAPRSIAELPRGSPLSVLIDGVVYPLSARDEAGRRRYFAALRPNLVAELAERASFDEIVWQLARPLDAERIRVVGLEPGGAAALAPIPAIERATGRALVDTLDPAGFTRALDGVRGQTLVITGRIEAGTLHVKPASGPERTLALADVMAAAEAADVNLFVLRSASPRQPGGRNWLWQKVRVKRLDDALARTTTADFLAALGGSGNVLAVTARQSANAPQRTVLDVTPAAAVDGAGGIGGSGWKIGDLVAEVTGHVVLAGVHADVRSSARQRELDRRLVAGVPALAQFVYLGFALLGLIGARVAEGWFGRLWPREQRAEYAGAGGYWSAMAARQLAFWLLFVPLVGPISAPFALARWMTGRTGPPWRGSKEPRMVG